MYKLFVVAIALACSLQVSSLHAQDIMELRGKSAGCDSNQKMNLWDISSDSPLIRNDMLRSGFCFMPTLEGLKVYVVENIGKFSRVRNLSNNAEYLIYRSDLRKAQNEKKHGGENFTNMKLKLKSIANLIDGEVYEINGKPTVMINLDVDSKFTLQFTIPKFAVDASFDEKIINQNNPKLQVGGKCYGAYVGVGSPDWYRLKIIELDSIKKIAIIQISGLISKCSLDNPSSYYFDNSLIAITGKNFAEFIRPHTSKEMSRVFKPLKW